jgi:GTPase involved in cell partitioning and DNA repair
MEAQVVLVSPGRTMAPVMLVHLLTTLGIPDGGDGGLGGDVYFRSTGRLSSLYDLRRAHFYGNNGRSGTVD